MLRRLLPILLLLGSTAVQADYQSELITGYGQLDEDFLERDTYQGGINWYWSPVDDRKGPLAEAAFLSRSSSIGYLFQREDTTQPGISSPIFNIPDSDQSIDRHGIEIRRVHAHSGWFGSIAFGLNTGDISRDSFGDADLDGFTGSLSIGRYLANQTSIALAATYRRDESDLRVQQEFCIVFLPNCRVIQTDVESKAEQRALELRAHHLGNLGRFNYAIDATIAHSVVSLNGSSRSSTVANPPLPSPPPEPESEIRFDEVNGDNWSASIGTTFYPTLKTSVAVAYAYTEAANEDNHNYRIGLGWFLSSSIEISAEHFWSHTGGPAPNTDQWQLSVRGRF